jgi:hypothetical protein
MKRYGMQYDDSNNANIGEEEDGEYVKVSDVIAMLNDIDFTCGDWAWDEVSAIIAELEK